MMKRKDDLREKASALRKLGKTQKEIASVLKLSQGRVSQLLNSSFLSGLGRRCMETHIQREHDDLDIEALIAEHGDG